VSSSTFSAELRPDPLLRRIVLGSGLLLYFACLLVIATLRLEIPARAMLALCWSAVILRQWLSYRRSYARNGILRIEPGGSIRCRQCDGSWQSLEILPGSVVTSRWAWLRLRAGRGPDYAELLRGESRQSEEWRRFQVIWRHVGAAG
jgi:hypothetical protein